MSTFHELVIADIRPETRDAVSITFAVPEGLKEQYRYREGQHLALRTRIDGEEIMRTYSICAAMQNEELRIAVKKQPHGRFSTFAGEKLHKGDVLEVLPPRGHFHTTLNPANAKHYLAVAAGSGITPIISILETTLIAEPRSRCTLVYGNRSTATMMFREQLEDLKNKYMGRLNLINVMSREQTDIDLFHGHIDAEKCEQLFGRWIDADTVDEAFICGPEPMINAVADSLRNSGLDDDHIHFELFTAPGEAKTRHKRRHESTGTDRTVSKIRVIAEGRSLEFELPRNTVSILDAGMSAGADLPHSCKGGVCSTCRAKVIEGEVEMDVNYALEDYEVKAGYVLTCQSYPVTDKVVVDYDA